MMKNQSYFSSNTSLSKVLKKILIIGSLLALIIPMLVNLLLYLPIPTAVNLGNAEWLSFWGSYIGGCLGGVCTLITIYVTIKYYEKQEKSHKEELEVQNKRHDLELKEETLRRYRPLLILQPNGGNGLDGKYNPFTLHVNNVSEYAVINVRIEDQYIALMKAGEEKNLRIISTLAEGGYNEFLEVSACDVLGNEYVWKYQLQVVSEIKKQPGAEIKYYYYKIIEEHR